VAVVATVRFKPTSSLRQGLTKPVKRYPMEENVGATLSQQGTEPRLRVCSFGTLMTVSDPLYRQADMYSSSVASVSPVSRMQKNMRADERTRTACPCSLRVIGHVLQGCAENCKCRLFRGVSFPCLAECCTVLRCRWYQSGIKRPPMMHRGRYPMSGLALLSPFPECEGTPHLWIATLTGYRLWADMPLKGWTKRRTRLKLLLPSASPWGWVGTQPQRDMGGLHRLPHDSYEVTAQGVEVGIVTQLGREGF
jgi:hypothetical protein